MVLSLFGAQCGPHALELALTKTIAVRSCKMPSWCISGGTINDDGNHTLDLVVQLN